VLRFVADECVSSQTVRLLKDLGFDVETIQELGKQGAEDDEVFRVAQEKEAILITYDKGFGNVLRYAPESHHGVVILKVRNSESLRGCHRVLEKLLEAEVDFKGILFIIDENKYRKRK